MNSNSTLLEQSLCSDAHAQNHVSVIVTRHKTRDQVMSFLPG